MNFFNSSIENAKGKNKEKSFEIPFDIYLGNLGNSFLLTALISILYTRENYLLDLFENNSFNNSGIYGIRLLVQGELKLFLIDDLMPLICENEKKKEILLSFTSSKKNKKKKEIWLPLLEKAYAKANGKSYLKNLYGTIIDAFNITTFAPTFALQHKKYFNAKKSEAIWSKILEASLKKYPICVSTEDFDININEINFQNFQNLFENENENEENNPNNINNINNINKNNKSSSGISNSNNSNSNLALNNNSENENNFFKDEGGNNKTFAVLNIYEFEETRLIKIWTAKKEEIEDWNGLYADESDEWSSELMDYVGYRKSEGVIYLTFEEYLKIFSWTYICKIEDNFSYRILKSKNFRNYFELDKNGEICDVNNDCSNFNNEGENEVIGYENNTNNNNHYNSSINLNNNNNNYNSSEKINNNNNEECEENFFLFLFFLFFYFFS